MSKVQKFLEGNFLNDNDEDINKFAQELGLNHLINFYVDINLSKIFRELKCKEKDVEELLKKEISDNWHQIRLKIAFNDGVKKALQEYIIINLNQKTTIEPSSASIEAKINLSNALEIAKGFKPHSKLVQIFHPDKLDIVKKLYPELSNISKEKFDVLSKIFTSQENRKSLHELITSNKTENDTDFSKILFSDYIKNNLHNNNTKLKSASFNETTTINNGFAYEININNHDFSDEEIEDIKKLLKHYIEIAILELKNEPKEKYKFEGLGNPFSMTFSKNTQNSEWFELFKSANEHANVLLKRYNSNFQEIISKKLEELAKKYPNNSFDPKEIDFNSIFLTNILINYANLIRNNQALSSKININLLNKLVDDLVENDILLKDTKSKIKNQVLQQVKKYKIERLLPLSLYPKERFNNIHKKYLSQTIGRAYLGFYFGFFCFTTLIILDQRGTIPINSYGKEKLYSALVANLFIYISYNLYKEGQKDKLKYEINNDSIYQKGFNMLFQKEAVPYFIDFANSNRVTNRIRSLLGAEPAKSFYENDLSAEYQLETEQSFVVKLFTQKSKCEEICP